MDPRIDRTRQHVLACAREILLDRGADAVTYSEVGRVARVSRNTLYRHWPTREKLLADLTLSYYADQEGDGPAAAGAGSVADFLESVRENLCEPGSAETLSLLISRADHDPAIAQALRDVAQLRQETLSKVTGPLTDAGFALIIGPLLFQAVIARRPVTDEFLDELAAASAARSESRTHSPLAEIVPPAARLLGPIGRRFGRQFSLGRGWMSAQRVERLFERGLQVADAVGGLHYQHAALDSGQHRGRGRSLKCL